MTLAPFSPAAERNKEPILAQLRQVLPPQGAALEIASGTGQHAQWFAMGLPRWRWQPTEVETSGLAALAASVAAAALPNLLPPRRLDVRSPQWPADGPPFEEGSFDAVYCANMLHIAPWDCCAGLMRGTARVLGPLGVLMTYGPYLEDDVATAPSNLAFDRSLRERDPAWGLRRREAVAEEAARAGLRLRERYPMPANNLLLVFAREGV